MLIQLLEDINNFIGKRKSVIYWTILFMFAGYGFKVFNFSLTLDNDWNIIMASEKPFSNIDFFFYGNSRYVSGLLRKLFSIDGSFVPFISSFAGVIFLGISAIILCVIIDRILEGKPNNLPYIAFIGIYLTVPFLYSQQFAFDISIDVSKFTLVVVTIVAYYLTFNDRMKPYRYLICCIAIVLSFNASQNMVSQYISLFFFILLLELMFNDKMNLKNAILFSIPFITAGIVGLMGYALISKIGAVIMNTKYGYIENMIGWTTYGLMQSLTNIITSIIKIFYWKSPYGSIYNFISLCIFIIALIKLLLNRLLNFNKIIYIIGVFILFFISNFSMCIALGNDMPYRTFVGVPLFISTGWFLVFHLIEPKKFVKNIVLIIYIITVSKQVLLLNTFFYSTHQTAELEKIYAIEIAHDIIKANNGEMPSQPVLFVGGYETSTPQTIRFEGVGSTMLNWYEPIRKYNIMKSYGYSFNDSLMNSEEANNKAAKISVNMPKWPAEDSIKIADDMIVVKLSGMYIEKFRGSKEEFLGNIRNDSENVTNYWIDKISFSENSLQIYGWAYLKNLNSEYTTIKVALVNESNQYLLNLNKNVRNDIDNAFNPLKNGIYKYSGINEYISLESLESGDYEALIILQNGESNIYFPLNYTISLK